ncbi:MAG TPA: hypothetical protein VG755_29040 [Nannocystaceae bacterium]|nr:hypothetical protein [Nannocystaceae bacterium]
MGELAIVEVSATHAIATWRNLLVCVLAPGSPAVFARVAEVQSEQHARWPDGLVSMTLLIGNFSSLFSSESRAQARRQLAETSNTTLAMALVIRSPGMLASATRTTMNALSAILKMRTPWRSFDDVGPAAEWLAPNVAGAPDAETIAAIAREVFGLTEGARANA